MKVFLSALLCLLGLSTCFGQGEANNWYFGREAGVTFNTSPPSALTNGQLDTNEGCSSISDTNGSLLFYTDGRNVWNRNHRLMANADYDGGTGLLGDPSSTSSGLIIPHPTRPEFYYIFTVDEPHHDNAAAFPNQGPADQNGRPTPDGEYTDGSGTIPQADDGFNNGFNYSLVDLTLNGGLGDVVTSEKNVPLITYNTNDSEAEKFKCSEKITAVRGSDCNSFWVITHFVDTFYAFNVSASGVNTTPVTSTVGPTVPYQSYRRAAIGYMKASPDGTRIAVAHNTLSYNPSEGNNDAGDGGVYLYDFDAVTGRLTNNQELITNVNAYSVEFSSNSKRLYGSLRGPGITSVIQQWDLENTDIPNSRRSIAGAGTQSTTALQLAPDGKIYQASFTSRLYVINNPNELGNAVNYSQNTNNGAIDLLNRITGFGLPPFIQSIFNSRIDIVNNPNDNTNTLNLCDGETYTLSTDFVTGATYMWYKDDVLLSTETGNTLDIMQPNGVTLPYSENYRLEVDLNNGQCPSIGNANVTYSPLPNTTDTNLVQCQDATMPIGQARFNLTQANPTITNQNTTLTVRYFEDIGLTIPISATDYTNNSNNQIVYAQVVTPSNCSRTAQVQLEVQNRNATNATIEVCGDTSGFASFNLSDAETTIKMGLDPSLQVTFYEFEEDAFLEQGQLPDNYDIAVPFQQRVFARVEDGNNECFGISEVLLIVNTPPELQDDETVIYCLDQQPNPISISSGVIGDPNDFTFLWSPSGETTESIATNNITMHTVTATNKGTGCNNNRTITLTPSNSANILTVNITDLSENNTVIVSITPDSLGDYEYAIDDENGPYQDDPKFTNVSPGLHKIYVRDKNGCGILESKDIGVLGFMQFFTPNGDGFNDTWRIVGITRNREANARVYIFDRYGKLIKNFIAGTGSWDGTFNDRPMPSNDYWYHVIFEDGREFKSHFTLKR